LDFRASSSRCRGRCYFNITSRESQRHCRAEINQNLSRNSSKFSIPTRILIICVLDEDFLMKEAWWKFVENLGLWSYHRQTSRYFHLLNIISASIQAMNPLKANQMGLLLGTNSSNLLYTVLCFQWLRSKFRTYLLEQFTPACNFLRIYTWNFWRIYACLQFITYLRLPSISYVFTPAISVVFTPACNF
jgi:hypothetical protein